MKKGSLLAALGPMLLLTACVPQKVNVNGVLMDTGSQPPQPGKGYSAVCSIPPSMSNFDRELSAVVAAEQPIGAILEVYMPTRRSVGQVACTDMMHEAQIEAIRLAKLFKNVVIRKDAPRDVRPPANGADNTIWAEGDDWVLTYKNGPRFSIPNGPNALDGWVKTIGSTFANVKEWAESKNDVMQAHVTGPHILYVVDGKEYADGASLAADLKLRGAQLLSKVQPAEPFGGKLRIVLPTEKAQTDDMHAFAKGHNLMLAAATPGSISLVSRNITGPQGVLGIDFTDGVFAYESVFTDLKAEAVRRSALFDAVEVTHEDLDGSPAFDNQGVVIWQVKNAMIWNLRVGLSPIERVDWPKVDKDQPDLAADRWVQALRAAAVKAKAAASPEDTDRLLSGCALPAYPKSAGTPQKGGAVVYDFTVAVDGKVSGSQIVTSSGNKDLDEATRAAFSHCGFKPGAKNGKPAVTTARIKYVWPVDIVTSVQPAPAKPAS